MDGSQNRGKCEDILDDASAAVKNALEIIQSLNIDEEIIIVPFTNFLERYNQTIKKLKQECQSIDHRNEDIKLHYHLYKIDMLIELPALISRGILLLQNWKAQITNPLFSTDMIFAKHLISEAFKDLNIDSNPIPLFADRFTAFNTGDSCFVTIPYVFHNKYDYWWGIFHEIGHVYYSKFLKDIDLHSLEEEIDKMITDSPSLNEEVTKLGLESKKSIFLSQWTMELLSDYVALCLFGLHYLIEIQHSDYKINLGLASKSHPPMGFRLTCLRWALEYNEIDLKGAESYFEDSSPLDQQLEPIFSVLTSSEMAKIFSKWMLSQKPYKHLRVRWTEILNLGIDDIPKDVSLVTLFASMSILNASEADVQELFLALRKRIVENSNSETAK